MDRSSSLSLQSLAEYYRLLKPGGRFSSVDAWLAPTYNPSNPGHATSKLHVKLTGGINNDCGANEFTALVRKAGFKILQNGEPFGLPYKLWESAIPMYHFATCVVGFLGRFGIIPGHLIRFMETVTQFAYSPSDGERIGV